MPNDAKKQRKILMPTAYFGLDDETRDLNERTVTKAFSDAGLDVTCQRIDLSKEQAELVMRLPKNNPIYQHELDDLAGSGRISCLVTLTPQRGKRVDVDEVLRKCLPLHLDKFERREFFSKSPGLVDMYGGADSLYARFLPADKL